jgi:hypothetical protein
MMANHGYISRDGVDSVVNIIMASQKMFGMGHDLATYLTTYAALVAGDLVSVSIGGPPPSRGLLGGLTSLASDLNLLGKPQGLSRSHNRFENDMSPTREDLYLGYVFYHSSGIMALLTTALAVITTSTASTSASSRSWRPWSSVLEATT